MSNAKYTREVIVLMSEYLNMKKQKFISFITEGMVKKINKAKKNLVLHGIKPEDSKNPAFKPQKNQNGVPKLSDRQAKHRAMRGIKTKGQFTEAEITHIFEGLVKKLNKAKKNALQGNTPEAKVAARKNAKAPGTSNTAMGHRALDDAGKVRRQGKKGLSKMLTKASRDHRQGTFETIKLVIKTRLAEAILEGRDDTSTDHDSIKNAGGDPDVYAKLKAAKDSKGGSAKPPSSRTAVLGRFGGLKDKKGRSPSQKPKSASNFAKGERKKPMPLNLKGKPKNGKKMGDVRGKAINTSRSTGNEADKAEKNQSAFGKFVSKLGGFNVKAKK